MYYEVKLGGSISKFTQEELVSGLQKGLVSWDAPVRYDGLQNFTLARDITFLVDEVNNLTSSVQYANAPESSFGGSVGSSEPTVKRRGSGAFKLVWLFLALQVGIPVLSVFIMLAIGGIWFLRAYNADLENIEEPPRVQRVDSGEHGYGEYEDSKYSDEDYGVAFDNMQSPDWEYEKSEMPQEFVQGWLEWAAGYTEREGTKAHILANKDNYFTSKVGYTYMDKRNLIDEIIGQMREVYLLDAVYTTNIDSFYYMDSDALYGGNVLEARIFKILNCSFDMLETVSKMMNGDEALPRKVSEEVAGVPVFSGNLDTGEFVWEMNGVYKDWISKYPFSYNFENPNEIVFLDMLWDRATFQLRYHRDVEVVVTVDCLVNDKSELVEFSVEFEMDGVKLEDMISGYNELHMEKEFTVKEADEIITVWSPYKAVCDEYGITFDFAGKVAAHIWAGESSFSPVDLRNEIERMLVLSRLNSGELTEDEQMVVKELFPMSEAAVTLGNAPLCWLASDSAPQSLSLESLSVTLLRVGEDRDWYGVTGKFKQSGLADWYKNSWRPEWADLEITYDSSYKTAKTMRERLGGILFAVRSGLTFQSSIEGYAVSIDLLPSEIWK